MNQFYNSRYRDDPESDNDDSQQEEQDAIRLKAFALLNQLGPDADEDGKNWPEKPTSTPHLVLVLQTEEAPNNPHQPNHPLMEPLEGNLPSWHRRFIITIITIRMHPLPPWAWPRSVSRVLLRLVSRVPNLSPNWDTKPCIPRQRHPPVVVRSKRKRYPFYPLIKVVRKTVKHPVNGR